MGEQKDIKEALDWIEKSVRTVPSDSSAILLWKDTVIAHLRTVRNHIKNTAQLIVELYTLIAAQDMEKARLHEALAYCEKHIMDTCNLSQTLAVIRAAREGGKP